MSNLLIVVTFLNEMKNQKIVLMELDIMFMIYNVSMYIVYKFDLTSCCKAKQRKR